MSPPEQYSAWQAFAGLSPDGSARLIIDLMGAHIEDYVDAPAEPPKPEPTEDGEYALLYRGWAQTWFLRDRYATKADAFRAARIAETRAREANGPTAYGWTYAVAALMSDGELSFDGGLQWSLVDDEEAE